MSKVWRRLQRVGKTAYKFEFTIKVHTVTLECVSGWTPNQVSILWVRRGRKVRTEVTSWTTMPGKDTQGVVHWQALEATMTLYMDTNSTKQKFDEKYWTLVVENVGPDGRHKALATKRINMGQFADPSLLPHESREKYRMKPVASKVHLTELAVTFISKFERQGPAIDDDMRSVTSEMSALTFGGFEDGYMSENEFENYNENNKEENEQIMKEIAAIGADFRQLSTFNEEPHHATAASPPLGGSTAGRNSLPGCLENNKQSNGTTSHQEMLIAWSRKETEDYKNISIEDLTDSWGDGAAFCAIIHKYCPDLIKMSQLKDPYTNVKQATKAAVSLGLSPSLDPLDFHKARLDELSILTFVDQLYKQFKNDKPQAESTLNMSREPGRTPELIRNNTLPSRKLDLDDSAEEKRRKDMIAKGRLRASRRRPNKNKSETSLESVPQSPRIQLRKSPLLSSNSHRVTSPANTRVTESPSPVPISPRSVGEEDEVKSELSSPAVTLNDNHQSITDLLNPSSPHAAPAKVRSSFGDDIIMTSGPSLDPDELIREFNRHSPLFLVASAPPLELQVSQTSSVDDQLVIDALIGRVAHHTPPSLSERSQSEDRMTPGLSDRSIHASDDKLSEQSASETPVFPASADQLSDRLSEKSFSTSAEKLSDLMLEMSFNVSSTEKLPFNSSNDKVSEKSVENVNVSGEVSPDPVSVESAEAILQSLEAEVIRSPSSIRISGIQSAEEEVIDPTTLSIKLNESKDETALAKEAILSGDGISDSDQQPEVSPAEKTPDFDEIIRAKFSTDAIPEEKPVTKKAPSPPRATVHIESDIEAEISALERQLSSTLDPLSPVALHTTVTGAFSVPDDPAEPTPIRSPPPPTVGARGSSLRDKIRGLHNAREKLMTACPEPVVGGDKPAKSKPPVFPKPMMKNRSRDSMGVSRTNSQESDRSRRSSSSKSSAPPPSVSGDVINEPVEKELPVGVAECPTSVTEEKKRAPQPNYSSLERNKLVAHRLSTEVVVESVSNTETSVDVAVSLTLERDAKPPNRDVTPPRVAETAAITSRPSTTSKTSPSKRKSGAEIQSLSELISSFSPKTQAESSSEEPVHQPRGSSPSSSSTNEQAACGSRDSLNRSRDSVNGSRGAMATGSRDEALAGSKATLGSSTSSVSSDPPPPPPPPGPLAMMMGPEEEEGEEEGSPVEEAQSSSSPEEEADLEESLLDQSTLDKQDIQDVRNYIGECNTRISEHNAKLDKRAKVLEKELRVAMDAQNHELEQRLLKSWLHLVHERNTLVRKQDELNSLQNEEHLEERCVQVFREMRKYQNIREVDKTEYDVDREDQLEEEYKEILKKREVLLRIRDDINTISMEEEAEFRSVIEKPKLLQDQSSCKVS